MLQPKRTKFRKQHKGRIHGTAKGGTDLNVGAFGGGLHADRQFFQRRCCLLQRRRLTFGSAR